MFQSWLLFTFAFTALAFLMTIFRAGSGMLLFLAMLGPLAICLVPPHLVLALPSALLGGVLHGTAGPRLSEERPRVRDVASLAILGTALCLLIVGWAMPAGVRNMGQAMARYQDPAPAPQKVAPASLDLPDLLAETSPEARKDLKRRMTFVLPMLFAGVFVTVLVASPISWSREVAVGVGVVSFVLHVSMVPLL